MQQTKFSLVVLQLMFLGGRSHTGPELLKALNVQVKRWLTQFHIQSGKVMCDNDTNLLAKLYLGTNYIVCNWFCLTHVFKLMVQQFIKFMKYPGF